MRVHVYLHTFLPFTSFTLPDLTPNPGLWWYFFTEMFDHFRPFFLMVFSVRSSSLLFEPPFDSCRSMYSFTSSLSVSNSSMFHFTRKIHEWLKYRKIRSSLCNVLPSWNPRPLQAVPNACRFWFIHQHDYYLPGGISMYVVVFPTHNTIQ